MDITNANGYTLNNLGKINVILGKNGCGKSTLLQKIEQCVSSRKYFGNIKYIIPESGGN